MGYAAIGIPLMLLYLSSVGSLLSDCARGVFTPSLCCCLCSNCGYCCYDEKRMQDKERRTREKREQKERGQEWSYVRRTVPAPRASHCECLAPLVFCFAVLVVYICVGALVLCHLETSSSYLDGIFFCFMTLSTIGFGDSGVPYGVFSEESNQNRAEGNAIFWLSSLYILVGMALTSMCFNILHYEVVRRFKHNESSGGDGAEADKTTARPANNAVDS